MTNLLDGQLTNNQLLHRYYPLVDELNIPRETVKLLLLELCNEVNYNLYLHLDDLVDQEIRKKFDKMIVRILEHEPLNYVLGFAWFYGHKFIVDETVLIPRYETEELVSNILNYLDNKFKDYKEIKAVDIGTGSGAIAISIAKEEAKVKMSASDISQEAVNTASKNATLNEVDIDFKCGNMLDPFIEANSKFDLIICNPPYIPQDEDLEVSVKEFEPHLALFGGSDGLKYYREVFDNCQKILNKNALLAFEIGWNQKEVLLQEVRKRLVNSKAEVIKDINGKDRMLFVEIAGE